MLQIYLIHDYIAFYLGRVVVKNRILNFQINTH